jgi:predicted transposase/invertase (TIGR01784 family)
LDNITNIHDVIFRELFSNPSKAAEIITAALLPAATEKLQLDTLALLKAGYTDENLSEHFADVLYRCQTINKKQLTIAILIEHKSYPEKYIHLQLLRYISLGWQQQLKAKEPPTPIIPIVFYHGSTKWQYVSLSEMLGIDESLAVFKPYTPDFEYAKLDLQQAGDEQILHSLFNDAIIKLMSLLFKHYHERAYVVSQLSVWLTLVEESDLTDETEQYYVGLCFRYLLEKIKVSKSKLMKVLKEKKKAKTPWDRFVEEYTAKGKKEGIKEGKLEGKMEIAKQMLLEGLDNALIIKLTGLSEEQLLSLQADI